MSAISELLLNSSYNVRAFFENISRPKPSYGELTDFFREVTSSYKNDVNWQTAIEMLIDDVENERLRDALLVIITDLENGVTLADAFSYHDIFPEFVIETLRAGEDTDSMSEQLVEIMKYLKNNEKIYRKINRAMRNFYFMMSIVLLTLCIFVYFAIPNLFELYRGLNAKISPSMLQLMETVQYGMEHIYILIIPFLFLPQAVKLIEKKFPVFVGRLKFKLPLYRKYYWSNTQYLFSKLMAIFIKMGETPTNAIMLTSAVIKNKAVNEMLEYVDYQISQGEQIAEALKNANTNKMISSKIVKFIKTCETTGRSDLPELLLLAADDYDDARTEAANDYTDNIMILGIVICVSFALLILAALLISLMGLTEQIG
ncbi:type II secretion system F family protein [Sporomusa sphaeroides]|uniref:Type II secretion system protein F n=1 Tax=Sporomusa sphaeroides DSM 2875 TaxID=1337886 RepID=A0A1U7M9Q6_9FIRM|nr:type II secretion system F family protein [Sporomusa sphaeroides]OLS54290.1 type II secretion system protein F [Sporomusa sphaeroides DSM 2875]CVK21670.1 Type II secretion system protein F [Sporomusa sphaeroides DSM 2875]